MTAPRPDKKKLRRDMVVAASCGAVVALMVGASYAAVPFATVHYKVVNQAARAISAQASYNVSPPQAGVYFNKINCFCFTEQTLKAGETREMAVVFYVDPEIVKDRDHIDLNTITLSYTFYRLPDAARPVAEAPDGKSSKL
jgi:cytochrome c oxidase assembly protein subunit 11